MLRATLKFIFRNPRLSALLFILIVSPILWFSWDAFLTSRVQRIHDELTRAHYPIVVSQLNPPAILDEVNAWVYQSMAADVAMRSSVDSPRTSIVNFPQENPKSDQWMKMAQASEQAHQKAFELAHIATNYPKGWIDRHYTDSSIPISITGLTYYKHLANILADSAQYNNQLGNPSLALDRIIDTLHLARILGDDPDMFTSLVSRGIHILAVDDLLEMAPTFKAEDLPQTREKIEKLIRDLLDEKPRVNFALAANAADRLNIVVQSEQLYDLFHAVRPLGKMGEIHSYKAFKWFESALQSPDWQKILDRDRLPAPEFAKTIGDMPISSAWVVGHYRSIAESRVAAAALACHLYRMDHGGQFPQTLAELTPKYLPFVPDDPYAKTPAPIGYLPHQYKLPDGSADRPMLLFRYGTQDLGPNPKAPVYNWEPGRIDPTSGRPIGDFHQYRDLTWFTPLVSPNNTLNNQPDKSDEAGDENHPENPPPDESLE